MLFFLPIFFREIASGVTALGHVLSRVKPGEIVREYIYPKDISSGKLFSSI